MAGPKAEAPVDSDELDPYLGDGPSGEYFSRELALVRLLTDDVLFSNGRYCLELDGKTNAGEMIVLFVSCNDLFYWGCADAEQLPYKEIRPLYELHIADPKWGAARWCCRRRNLRPQAPIERDMRATWAWSDELEALPKPEPSLAWHRK